MAVALVQAKVGSSVGSTTVSVTLASTPTTGNFLIAFCSDVSSPGTASLDGANWQEFAGSPFDAGTSIRLTAFWKPADATTAYTFTSTDSGNLGLMIAEVSGLSETFLIDAGFVEGEMLSSGTSCAYGSISPDEPDSITFLACSTAGLPTSGGHVFPGTFTILDTLTNRRFNACYKIGGPATYSGNVTFGSVSSAQTIMLSLAPSSATGTAAPVLDDFTMSASCGHGVDGTSATTLGAFTMAASGTSVDDIFGTSDIMLDAFTMAADGAAGAGGTFGSLLDDFTMAASGGHGVDGSSAAVVDDFTMAATGSVGLAPDGVFASTLDEFTMAGEGTFPFTGTIEVTLDDFTMAADGSSVSGTVAVTLGEFVMAADAEHAVGATGEIVLDAFTMAAAGSQPPYGECHITLDDFTADAAGEAADRVYLLIDVIKGDIKIKQTENFIVTRRPTGRGVIRLDDFTMEASGAHAVTGTGDLVLGDFTMEAESTVTYAGSAALTLGDFTMEAEGGSLFTGTATVVMDEFTMAGDGIVIAEGSAALTLDAFTMSGDGSHEVSGTSAMALSNFTMSGVGGHGPTGTGAVSLGSFTMSATGSAEEGDTGEGLSLLGQIGEYAYVVNDAQLMPPSVTQVEMIAYFQPSDWQGYYGPVGQGTQQTIFGVWDGSINERSFDIAINTNGDIVLNLSRDGSAISAKVGVQTEPADGVGLWVKANWNSTGGVRNIYVRAAQDTIPTDVEFGSPIATDSGILSGLTLNQSTANLVIGATDGGAKSPFGGLIKYTELRYQIGGPAVFKCDYRTYPNDSSSFIDAVGGRTIQKITGSTAADVGMPNGEAANVGPTANYKGHVGIAFSQLSAQVDTLVISNAVATAKPTTVTSDGVTRYVFEKLNVFVAIRVTADVPILIKDSRFGALFDNADADIWIEWSISTRAFLRTGDRTPTATLINDGTFNGTSYVAGTSASLNWAVSWGSGGDLVTVASDGLFTDANVSTAGKCYVYRCNFMGQTDGFSNKGVVGSGNPDFGYSDLTVVETWIHTRIWFPHDAARKSKTPSNSHHDTIKIIATKGARFINCRDDLWPILASDYASLSGPAFLSPHIGKNPNNNDWPCRRQDAAYINQKFVGTGFINCSLTHGNGKNVLLSGCIFSGPVSRFIYMNSSPDGKACYNWTMIRCQFLSGITDAGPTFTQPRSGISSFSGVMTATGFAAVWNMPLSGTDVNYGPDGSPYTTFWRAGMNNSSAFVEI